MKLIYACSPYRGQPPYTDEQREQNLQAAARHSLAVAMAGNIPITPHLYFSQFLCDDNASEREHGMAMGRELLTLCDEIYVFGNELSEGMRVECQLAAELKIPIRHITQQSL